MAAPRAGQCRYDEYIGQVACDPDAWGRNSSDPNYNEPPLAYEFNPGGVRPADIAPGAPYVATVLGFEPAPVASYGPSPTGFLPTDFGRSPIPSIPEASMATKNLFSTSVTKASGFTGELYNPRYASAAGDIVREGFCGNLTGYAKAVCMLGGAVADVILPGGGGGGGGSTPTTTLVPCATGYVPCAATEPCRCKLDSALAQILPGDIGRQDQYGAAVMGAWGRAALTPLQRTMVTLLCPTGTVLGRDNLCYQKGSIPKTARKWNPGTKPLLTGGDVNVLRRAKGLQKKVHKLAVKFSPPKRSCAPKKRRK